MTANHRDALPEVLPLLHFFSVAVDTYTSELYMKVPSNSLELNDKLSFFVVSPPKGGG